MKSRIMLKFAILEVLLLTLANWAVRYNEMTAVALVFISLVVALKFLVAIVRRRNDPPGGNAGLHGINPRVRRPPGGRPPVLSAAAEVR